MSDASHGCGDRGPTPTRRGFLGCASAFAFGLLRRPQDPAAQGTDHLVPANKNLHPKWIEQLTASGSRQPWSLAWSGEQLRTVAMPCGGIGAGQLYVTGDGRLAHWWIANDVCHTSSGHDTTVQTPIGELGVGYGGHAPAQPIQQGTLLRWREPGGTAQVVALDQATFPGTTFLGWYPVATIDYRRQHDVPPVAVVAEVFSPFVPLSARASATPATLLRYTLRNQGTRALEVTLAPYLQNPVLRSRRGELRAQVRNIAVRQDRFVAVAMDAIAPQLSAADGRVTVFADFENGYGDWRPEQGDAFGGEPAAGGLGDQQPLTGQHGARLANSYHGGDPATGLLVSPVFTIEQPYIAFRIGGGGDLRDLALTLELVDGGQRRRVRAASGRNSEQLREVCWDVRELRGKRAVLTVRDLVQGPWGHVAVDYIRFCAVPPPLPDADQTHPQAGQVALVAFDARAEAHAGIGTVAALQQRLAGGEQTPPAPAARGPLGDDLLGAVASTLSLQSGETRVVTFAVTWYFPNRQQRDDEWQRPGQQVGGDGPRVGNMYANWFHSALDVAQHLADEGEALVRDTFDFVAALHTGTLPGWFVQRVSAPLATLATGTLQWWQNGRAWAFDGVGSGPGTCGQVWNYAQGMAWLFPELERSVRRQQDFARGVGLQDDGAIASRGRTGRGWAADAQAGYVLKAWREHRLAADGQLLRELWPGVRAALEFLLRQDGDPPDGLLEGAQPNTYGFDLLGANTLVGSLYLAALRAGARMAAASGEPEFATRLRTLAEGGAELTMQQLWNGDYFVQKVPPAPSEVPFQYGDGCLSDQLLGQWFADQVGLGSLYPPAAIDKALQAIWRHNWAPDVGPQAAAHPPERTFAQAGERGLFVCTWPKGRHRGIRGLRHASEVWTGIEYEVAACLLRRGFVMQGLAIVRAIHERYDGRRHNPYDEVECGDHGARALASWSCLLAISGFEFDGPAGLFGFAPQLQPEDFRCCFVAGTGWGTIAQQRGRGPLGDQQTATITLLRGELALATLRFSVALRRRVAGVALVGADGTAADAAEPYTQSGSQVEVRLRTPLRLRADRTQPATAIVQLLLE